MAKQVTMEEIRAMIHSSIATDLKLVAKLKKCGEEDVLARDTVNLTEMTISKKQALLGKIAKDE